MNSCLYECLVYHTRIEPKNYKFTHRIFMFYLDLDEIAELPKKFTLISHNRFNVYNFRDDDHWQAGADSVKENIIRFARSKGLTAEIHKIYLLTHLRTWGYGFNPVSFYFCFDAKGNPVCAIPEVSNTFREMKPYYLGPDKLKEGSFIDKIVKYFYISPFMEMDILMDFNLKIPGEKLELVIDELKPLHPVIASDQRERGNLRFENQVASSHEGAPRNDGSWRKIFYSGMVGGRKPLTNARLYGYSLLFPLITLKVIFLIHWHAWVLYFKKVPFFKKNEHPDLQRDMVPPRKK